MKVYLGVDVGSISTNFALVSEEREVLATLYLHTSGEPIKAVQKGLGIILKRLPKEAKIVGVGTTGSGRRLAGVMLGADIVKNEITAQAIATLHFYPKTQTIIEIGGQDSKIIIIRDGVAIDFAMNTICAAGTGSFLDHQAARLNISVEEFGKLALLSTSKVNIAGKCTVFAESDMIHKAQLGIPTPDIVKGLCEAIVRNYLNNVGRGKEILPPIVFQGGVAANRGVKRAFEEILGYEVIVPKYYNVMGAIGIALCLLGLPDRKDKVRILETDAEFRTKGFSCSDCPNQCEIIEVRKEEKLIDRWGSRCGKWD
jgi:predicted CoA-substrate-specific enzyme activase